MRRRARPDHRLLVTRATCRVRTCVAAVRRGIYACPASIASAVRPAAPQHWTHGGTLFATAASRRFQSLKSVASGRECLIAFMIENLASCARYVATASAGVRARSPTGSGRLVAHRVVPKCSKHRDCREPGGGALLNPRQPSTRLRVMYKSTTLCYHRNVCHAASVLSPAVRDVIQFGLRPRTGDAAMHDLRAIDVDDCTCVALNISVADCLEQATASFNRQSIRAVNERSSHPHYSRWRLRSTASRAHPNHTPAETSRELKSELAKAPKSLLSGLRMR